jgi:hypothetical protein
MIAFANQRNLPLHVVYTDINKAFPSVPYKGLLQSIQCLGLGQDYEDIVKDLLTNFSVQAQGPTGLSTEHIKESGIHEGCPASPSHFNIWLNMFIKWLNASTDGFEMRLDGDDTTKYPDTTTVSDCKNGIKITVSAQADDMALTADSHLGVLRMTKKLEQFLTYYKVDLGIIKCAYQYNTLEK